MRLFFVLFFNHNVLFIYFFFTLSPPRSIRFSFPLCVSNWFIIISVPRCWPQRHYIQILHADVLLECCSLSDARGEWRAIRRGHNMLFIITTTNKVRVLDSPKSTKIKNYIPLSLVWPLTMVIEFGHAPGNQSKISNPLSVEQPGTSRDCGLHLRSSPVFVFHVARRRSTRPRRRQSATIALHHHAEKAGWSCFKSPTGSVASK